MKKVISLLLALTVLLSFSMVVSAKELTVNVEALQLAQEDLPSEAVDGSLAGGDTFALHIECGSTTTKGFGFVLSFDESAFEVADVLYNPDYDDQDPESKEIVNYYSENHAGAVVVKPNGQSNKISVGGFFTSAKKVSAFVGVKVKDTAASGDYTFEYLEYNEDAMEGNTATAGDAATVTVENTPTPSNYNITYRADPNVIFDSANPTTSTGNSVTFNAKPAFGYDIVSVTGVVSPNARGGQYTATVSADTEIVVTVAARQAGADFEEVATGVIKYTKEFKSADGKEQIVFAKAPKNAAEFGIYLTKGGAPVDHEGNNGYFKADRATAEGAFGIHFIGLDPAAGYTMTPYALN